MHLALTQFLVAAATLVMSGMVGDDGSSSSYGHEGQGHYDRWAQYSSYSRKQILTAKEKGVSEEEEECHWTIIGEEETVEGRAMMYRNDNQHRSSSGRHNDASQGGSW